MNSCLTMFAKMSSFATIIILSVIMAAASYLAGLIPFFVTSNSHVSLLSQLGNGILLSTALVIVIPEGVTSMSDPLMVGVPLLLGFIFIYVVDGYQGILGITEPELPEEPDSETLADSNYRKWLPKLANWTAYKQHVVSNTFLIGLLVHSICDGIAFGASVETGALHLKLVIFISILVHKFPTSFALTSVLLQKYGNQHGDLIRFQLFLFSVSAPVAAIATYFVTILFDTINLTGWLLLFSGGSFLYVAVHLAEEKSENRKMDVSLNLIGMLIPLLVATLFRE